MTVEVDNGEGRQVGSEIRLSGRICGLNLAVSERVVERDPPHRKVWQTGRWLGALFAGMYARWRTQQMIEGVARHYNDREWHPVSRKNTHSFDT